MFVKLGKREVQILISHKKEEVLKNGHLTTRQTYVTIKEGNKTLLQGATYCSELDNFNYFEGRKKALKKALSTDGEKKVFTKEERKAIFEAVCPKLPESPNTRNQKKIEELEKQVAELQPK